MKGPLRVALSAGAGVLAGAALGAGACAALIKAAPMLSAQTNGVWSVSDGYGGSQAGPWLSAHVALTGLFALRPSEAVYFIAERDDAGRALEGRCRYRIVGPVPDGAWASLTAYGPDGFLIRNDLARHSVRLTPRGRADVIAAAAGPEPQRLPVDASKGFSLMLRVYEPSPALLADLAKAPAPGVERLECST